MRTKEPGYSWSYTPPHKLVVNGIAVVAFRIYTKEKCYTLIHKHLTDINNKWVKNIIPGEFEYDNNYIEFENTYSAEKYIKPYIVAKSVLFAVLVLKQAAHHPLLLLSTFQL